MLDERWEERRLVTREQLQRAASDTGFPIDSLEKVSMLVRLLNLMATHPFPGPRVALKGGTALNLFVFELPRLSVDVDVNYIGAADRETDDRGTPEARTRRCRRSRLASA